MRRGTTEVPTITSGTGGVNVKMHTETIASHATQPTSRPQTACCGGNALENCSIMTSQANERAFLCDKKVEHDDGRCSAQSQLGSHIPTYGSSDTMHHLIFS